METKEAITTEEVVKDNNGNVEENLPQDTNLIEDTKENIAEGENTAESEEVINTEIIVVSSNESLESKTNERKDDNLENDRCEAESPENIEKEMSSDTNSKECDKENIEVESMDKDLQNVIAEATKLQNQVLESIIGNNEIMNIEEVAQCETFEPKNEGDNHENTFPCKIEHEQPLVIDCDEVTKELQRKDEEIKESTVKDDSDILDESDDKNMAIGNNEAEQSPKKQITNEAETENMPLQKTIEEFDKQEISQELHDNQENEELNGEASNNNKTQEDIEENPIETQQTDIGETEVKVCATEDTEKEIQNIQIDAQSADSEATVGEINSDSTVVTEVENLQTKEKCLSPTPDVVEVSEKSLNTDGNKMEALEQGMNSINEDVKCSETDRESQIDELIKSLPESKNLLESNLDTSIQGSETQESRRMSKEIIVDLTPEPVMNFDLKLMNEAPSKQANQEKIKNTPNNKSKGDTNIKETINKKSQSKSNQQTIKGVEVKKSKNTTRKSHPKSTTIAGHKIDLNSDKPQYLHLTLEQIQELAMQQQSGELFTPDTHTETSNDSHCAVHSASAVRSKRSSKLSQNRISKKKLSEENVKKGVEDDTSQEIHVCPSPDVIREAEASCTENVEKYSKEKSKIEANGHNNSRESSPVRKSPSFVDNTSSRGKSTVKQTQENGKRVTKSASFNEKFVQGKKESKRSVTKFMEKGNQKIESQNDNTEKIHSVVTKRKSVEGGPKGGLLTPTLSWLSHIGEKKDLKERSPSPIHKEAKRSFSLPRKQLERSPSPQHKTEDSSCLSGLTNSKPLLTNEDYKRENNDKKEENSKNLTHIDDTDMPMNKSSQEYMANGADKENIEISHNKENMNINTKISKQKSKKVTRNSKKEVKGKENVLQKALLVSSSLSTTIDKSEAVQETIQDVIKSDDALSTSSYKSDVSQKSSNKSSGVEETSISASEVIEKFESETQAFNENESNSNSIHKEPLKEDENSMEEKQKEECGKSAVSPIKLSKSKIATDKNIERKEISKSTNTKSANGMNNKREANGVSSKVGDKSKVITRNGRNLIKNAKNTNIKNSTESAANEIKEKTSVSKPIEINSIVFDKSGTFVKESTIQPNISNDKTKTRTTMIVKLHPGHSKRVSAYLEHQNGDRSSDSDQSSLHLLDDVQNEDSFGSICGLEISFSSVPQDIDIKLIPAGDICGE